MNALDNKQLFQTIVDQIIEYIALDVFEQGSMLISVRAYAQSMGINPNTVQKAYQKLEELGHIVSIEKKGSFVKDALYTKQQYQTMLQDKYKYITKKLKYTALSKQQLIEIVEKIFEEED